MMRAAALLTALMLLTAGCIGMGGDEADSDAETASTDAPGTNPGTNATGATNDSHEHEPAPEIHWKNVTGELEGESAYFVSRGLGNETVHIPGTIVELRVTLTVEDGEINGELHPPGCEPSGNTHGEECSESMNTYNDTQGAMAKDGGSVSLTKENPDEGNWTLDLYKADPGINSVPYTITFYYVDKHKPAADHGH